MIELGTVGIVGAGILGRLIALKLRQEGWHVTLWDRGNEPGSFNCSYAAAGMLAPYCELEVSEMAICRLGQASLALWPKIIEAVDSDIFFQRRGTLVVSHPVDKNDLEKLRRRATAWKGCFENISSETLRALEPELDRRFMEGLFFSDEGQIDNREVLAGLAVALRRLGVEMRFHETVVELGPRSIRTSQRSQTPEWVIDCRGLEAKTDFADLRGVRGELFLVEAPEVRLSRPIRLMHPRYPMYIAPRRHGRYLVGASVIESDDLGPVSVRSTLELLSAAFSVHSGFAEAKILESVVHCRPAFPNHLPRIRHSPGLLRVNGLYRHGYLVSPKLAEVCSAFLSDGIPTGEEAMLFEEGA